MPTETAATWAVKGGVSQTLAAARLRGEPAAGDGGGAGAAVGLDDVAVDGDFAFAEGVKVGDGAEAAADQAGDFLGASAVEGAFAAAAGVGGGGEHVVFGGDPAAAGAAHPAGDVFGDGGGAEDAGVAEGDEDGAGGVHLEAELEGEGAHVCVGAGVGSGHWGSVRARILPAT